MVSDELARSSDGLIPGSGSPAPEHPAPEPPGTPPERDPEPPLSEEVMLGTGAELDPFLESLSGAGHHREGGEPHGSGATAEGPPPDRPGTAETIASMELHAPPVAAGRAPSKPSAGGTDHDGPEDHHRPRIPWLTVILFNYASLVTVLCAWLYFHRPRSGVEGDSGPPPVDTRPDWGRRADQARKVEPPAPIPPERIVELGRSLRIGGLELTPLAVGPWDVRLVRTAFDGRREVRMDGKDALRLQLRLRNVSRDMVFAPLDEAFVRDRDRELPDSYIETDAGERIYDYPLAVESEWSLDGQEFRELRPGEAMQTTVVSAPEARKRAEPPMVWRLRFRTGIDQTAVVGVRISRAGEKGPRR